MTLVLVQIIRHYSQSITFFLTSGFCVALPAIPFTILYVQIIWRVRAYFQSRLPETLVYTADINFFHLNHYFTTVCISQGSYETMQNCNLLWWYLDEKYHILWNILILNPGKAPKIATWAPFLLNLTLRTPTQWFQKSLPAPGVPHSPTTQHLTWAGPHLFIACPLKSPLGLICPLGWISNSGIELSAQGACFPSHFH